MKNRLLVLIQNPDLVQIAHELNLLNYQISSKLGKLITCRSPADNQAKLTMLASDMRFTNPKMEQLESTLSRHFSPSVESRGIVFSKTRKSTYCLQQWVLANDRLRSAGVKSAIITGSAGMTQVRSLIDIDRQKWKCNQPDVRFQNNIKDDLASQQIQRRFDSTPSYQSALFPQQDRDETIRNFRLGSVNLLIATSVAEEGLDIPQCNLVVRYGLLTNEIAQQQASGRARAQDSHYSLVAERGGREERREHFNTYLAGLTARAVDKIHQMSPTEFRANVSDPARSETNPSKIWCCEN